MKDTISANTTIVSRSESIVSQLLRTISRVISTLFFALVVTVIVELVCVTWVWPEKGANKSVQMVASEIAYLGNIAERNPVLLGGDEWVVNQLASMKLLFVSLGLGSSAKTIMTYIEITMNMINVFFLRLAIMVFSFPVYVFAGFIGLTRGLVNRELRKWGGGRESSGKFHLFLNMVPLGFVSSWVFYLGSPFTINPNYIVMPFAIFFGWMLMLSAYRIKKYL